MMVAEAAAAAAKKCATCGKAYSAEDLVCVPCGTELEESLFLQWVYASIGVGAVSALLGWKLRITVGLSFANLAQVAACLLMIGYPLFKGITALRRPKARVSAEVGSVLGGRIMRGALLAFIAWSAARALGLLPLGAAQPRAPNPTYEVALQALQWASLGLSSAILLLAIRDQGAAFFRLGTTHTYVARAATPRDAPPKD